MGERREDFEGYGGQEMQVHRPYGWFVGPSVACVCAPVREFVRLRGWIGSYRERVVGRGWVSGRVDSVDQSSGMRLFCFVRVFQG